MKKKLALIIISLDECFSDKGFRGGGHKVTKYLISGLIESNLFDIDIYCRKSAISSLDGVNSITVLGKENFASSLQSEIEHKHYDYVLSSDILLPFANLVIHSNSAKFKAQNGKNIFMQKLSKLFRGKQIKAQQELFSDNSKHFFVVSESLKNDYVESYGLDEDKVFVCYPATDSPLDIPPLEKRDCFTIGSIAGGGLNKGGYLLLSSLRKLVLENKISSRTFKTRLIFPKIKKAWFYKLLVKILGLNEYVEILPKQADMTAFYQSIDCYVLPSLNEAFGLVVTEAASNGRMSVVSSTTGVRELVENGQNGFVFERKTSAISNLSNSLNEVYNLYFEDFEKFSSISNKAREISQKLDWKKFTDTIISNMKEENRD